LASLRKRDVAAPLIDGLLARPEGVSASVRLEALELGANVARLAGDFDRAERLAGEAFDLAISHAEDHAACRAATSRAAAVGHDRGRTQEALAWIRVARALVARLEAEGTPLEGHLDERLGALHASWGDASEAIQAYRRAVETFERELGPADLVVAGLRESLGSQYLAAELHAEALLEQKAVLAIRSDLLGPQHRAVLIAHGGLANVYSAMGKVELAEQEYARIVAAEAVLAPTDLLPPMARINLGRARLEKGRFAEADELMTGALARLPGAIGGEQYMLPALRARAEARLELGHLEAAAADARDALSRCNPTLDEDACADAQFLLARAVWRSDPSAALAIARAVLSRTDGAPARRIAVQEWLAAHVPTTEAGGEQ
jgi:tetratricopeptide (TPR) repeat protein